MSVASGGNEMETAVMQAEVSSGVQDENIVTLEASEDRQVHFVWVTRTEGNLLTEVSFSSSFELNNASSNSGDNIASGVLHAIRVRESDGADQGPTAVYYDEAPPQWDAGEEISLHSNNFSAATAQIRVIIGYTVTGEFSRSRLRNR